MLNTNAKDAELTIQARNTIISVYGLLHKNGFRIINTTNQLWSVSVISRNIMVLGRDYP